MLHCLFLALVSAIPETAQKPITDEYQGTKIVDDYRWLEDAKDRSVQKWSDAQNRHAREFLDRLPSIKAIQKRVTEIVTARAPDDYALMHRPNGIFAMRFEPPKQQPYLVLLKSPDDKTAEVLVDPNKLNPKGTTAIDFYEPSLDGKRVAVSLSEGGSESGSVHVYDVATKKELGDVIPRVNGGTAGGAVAWNADGTGFFYTRYPRGKE